MNSFQALRSKSITITVKVMIVVVVVSAFIAFFSRLPESNSYFTDTVNSEVRFSN